MEVRRPLAAVLAVLTIMAGLAVGSPSTVAGASDTTVPTQFIVRSFAELLGRAPTAAEWAAWESFFEGSSACVDELGVLVEHLTGVAARTDIDDGGSHLEFEASYPTTSLTSPVDYTGDAVVNGDDDEFYEHVVRAVRASAVTRLYFGHEVLDSDWALLVAPYVAGSRSWSSTVATADIWGVGLVGSEICSGTDPSYGVDLGARDCAMPVGGSPCPIDVLERVGVFLGHDAEDTRSRTQAEVEAALAVANVELKPAEVIRIGAEDNLLVPWQRTLRTVGSPAPQAYALMARLSPEGQVCDGAACSDIGIVEVQPAGRLHHVWVDGQSGDPDQAGMAAVETTGGGPWVPARVEDSRISNPPLGGAAVRMRGYATHAPVGCTHSRVERNLITGFQGAAHLDAHGQPAFADGIVVECEDATVAGNTIIDISGTGVAVLGVMNRADEASGVGQRAQSSWVHDNLIVNAGNPARSAIALDPVGSCLPYRASDGAPRPPVPCMDVPGIRSFDGTVVEDNELWTSDRVHYDVALMVGSRPFWGDAGVDGAGPVAIADNSTPVGVRATIGLGVVGMSGVTLSGNLSTFAPVNDPAPTAAERCPTVAVGARPADQTSLTADVTVTSLAPASGQPHVEGCAYPEPGPGGLSAVTAMHHGGGGSQLPAGCTEATDDHLYFADATCEPFTPFGYQYGVLELPPIGDDAWHSIARDLREMRLSGANIVRYSAETVQYFDGSQQIDEDHVDRLVQLVDIAGRAGMYVDLTGLATYETWGDDPEWAWFNGIAAEDYEVRWGYQAAFWEAASEALADRTNVAFYDLVNEPLGVPAEGESVDSWCPNVVWEAYCWNQVFLLEGDHHPWYDDQENEVPPVLDWVDRMVDAIDMGDPSRPLVSMGTIYCNFGAIDTDPNDDLDGLDFAITHVYPGSGLVWLGGDNWTFGPKTMPQSASEAEACKNGMDPHRPVIVEETYSMNVHLGLIKEEKPESLAAGLERWMVDTQYLDDGSGGETTTPAATGWIGNYLPMSAVGAPLSESTPPLGFWTQDVFGALDGTVELTDLVGDQSAVPVRVGSGEPDASTVIGYEGFLRGIHLNASGSGGNTVLQTPASDVGDDFTFETWFRSDEPVVQVLWAEDSGATGPTVRVLADGDVQLTTTTASSNVARGNATVLDGEWHHIMVTRSGTAAADTRIYVDGVETSYAGRNGYDFTAAGSNWWFGGRPSAGGSVTQDLRGAIADVAIYDQALPGSSAASHHAAAEPPARRGATMQDVAGDLAQLWPHSTVPSQHVAAYGGASPGRDRWIEAYVRLAIDEHPLRAVEGHLLLRYFAYDYTRFVQSNARYLGTSGPGA